MKRLTNFIKLPKTLPLYFFDVMILIVMGIEVLSLFFSVNPLKSRVMIVFSGVAILLPALSHRVVGCFSDECIFSVFVLDFEKYTS